MNSFKRTRIAVAAAMLAALSLSTVGFSAVASEAKGVSSLRIGDHWPS